MVGVVSGSLYRRTHSLSRLAWSWVGSRLAPFYIRQMNRVNSRNTIRYDSVYLTCSKMLTGSQLSLPHVINKTKIKCKTKNKMMSVISPVKSRYREAVQ